MKRKNASLLGNVLMGLGLFVMVAGVGYSILNQLPQLDLPQYFAHGAVLSIFLGAVLWLAGARVSGHEENDSRWSRFFCLRG
ncbi:stress-induced protein YchH [Enterobacter cloacae]|uniref:stress-induced protein YchH n=1 Tax=Enterobacter cloacae TaxID=550 RepID=UPI003F73D86E